MKRIKKILVVLISPLITFGCCLAQQTDLNQLVESAWQGINNGYFNPSFDTQNWQKLGSEIKTKKYSSTAEAYTDIQSLLSKLNDPSVRFLTADQTSEFVKDVWGGSQIGVGLAEMLSIDINEQTGKLTIVTPIPNSPAARSGLKPHDVVTAINNIKTERMSLSEAVSRLRGEIGTSVTISVFRQGKNSDVNVRRESIPTFTDTVYGEIKETKNKKIGYIALYQFTNTTGQKMRDTVEGLLKKGATDFVLDLRNNPGGDMSAAQEVAGIFIGSKPIAVIADKSGKSDLTATEGKLTDRPLAIIVNEGTASAAEVVAVGLHSQRRANIIGTRTFGKALVHGLTNLTDRSAIVLTIAQLQKLDGKEILGRGIMPDVLVEMDQSPILNPGIIKPASSKDRQYIRAVESLSKYY